MEMFLACSSHHACRTRAVWQYQYALALSGLLPPSPAPPGSGCPQLHLPAATGTTAAVFHLRSNRQRLTAHRVEAVAHLERGRGAFLGAADGDQRAVQVDDQPADQHLPRDGQPREPGEPRRD